MKKNRKINWNRTEGITIEEVLATKACAHFTIEQAQEFIDLVKVVTQATLKIVERAEYDESFNEQLKEAICLIEEEESKNSSNKK